MKKILSIILATVLVTSVIAFAYAEEIQGVYYDNETGKIISVSGEVLLGQKAEAVAEYLEEHSSDYVNHEKNLQQSIDDLITLGILNGYPDGEIHSDYNITRAEMAALICRTLYGKNYSHLNYEELKNFGINTEFSDLTDKHWAFMELALLSNENLAFKIIEGYEDNTIQPDANITYIEAATMILKMLNYNVLIEEKGGYPDGVEYWAEELSLFERTNAKNNLDNFAVRGDIIIMLSSALDSPVADTLDENCIRTDTWQMGPLSMRQYRDFNKVDEKDIFAIYQE